jgi:AraC-like DNA-binding protein/mannose-6-phosphate isomerase-like protein (cupin superfamily)
MADVRRDPMDEEKVEFRDNLHLSIKVQSIKRYPIHWHKNVTEILLPIKGSIEVIANYEHILVKEGDFWFVNNKTIHSVKAPQRAIVAVFHINLDYFQRQSEHIKYMFFRNNMFARTRKKIESDNFDDDIRKELKIRFRELLVNMLKDITNNVQLPKGLQENFEFQLVHSMMHEFHWLQFLRKKDDYISPFQLNRYLRIIKFIDGNYGNKITLKDVASQEFVTKNYLSHFWKGLSHFSFQERLSYERTIRAELLLLTTNMSIYHISEECGFSDVKYFYKYFRRWYGSTPLEHKKRCLLYEKKGDDYRNLEFNSIREMLDDYINAHLLPYNIDGQDSMFSSFIKNCNKIKRLYQADKNMIPNAPRNIIIDICSRNNFCIKDNHVIFNWYIIDQLVKLADSPSFNLSIELNPDYIEKPWFNHIIEKFLDSCIFRYGINTVKNWEFYVDYKENILYNASDTLRKIVKKRIKNVKANYYFRI